jgi:hypothetical protein
LAQSYSPSIHSAFHGSFFRHDSTPSSCPEKSGPGQYRNTSKRAFNTRTTGTYAITTTLGGSVRAFVPLPPADPPLAPTCFVDLNRQAELAQARLAGASGRVPSVEWPLYSAIRMEALLTSQVEGTQATLTDLFDEEAGLKVSDTDDVEDVTNYPRAFRWVQGQLRDLRGLPISVRLLCEAHRLLLGGVRGAGKQLGELRRSQNWIGGTRPGNAAFVPPPPQQVCNCSPGDEAPHADARPIARKLNERVSCPTSTSHHDPEARHRSGLFLA